jgi:hypothetical protein
MCTGTFYKEIIIIIIISISSSNIIVVAVAASCNLCVKAHAAVSTEKHSIYCNTFQTFCK